MGYLDVTLDTQTLRGSVGRAISVYTNDKTTPSLFLTLRATIRAGVELYPAPEVTLNNRNPERGSARLMIRKAITESGSLVVSDVMVSAAWLSVTVRPLEPDAPGIPGLPE